MAMAQGGGQVEVTPLFVQDRRRQQLISLARCQAALGQAAGLQTRQQVAVTQSAVQDQSHQRKFCDPMQRQMMAQMLTLRSAVMWVRATAALLPL